MKYLTGRIQLLFLCLLALGCQAPAPAPPQNLSPLKAEEWLRQTPQAQLIDVRTPEEYGPERLKGAKLIPVQELETRLAEIPKDKPVLLYCHSGKRSQKALDFLKSRGYGQLFQIEGGITAWKEAKLPVETSQPSKH